MKSQQRKKRIEQEDARRAAAIIARESDPYLMALYEAFLPGARFKTDPKYVDDKYGNRVLNEGVKV